MWWVRISYSIRILNHFHSRLQHFLRETSFICPSTGKMWQPDITTTDRQISRSKLMKLNILLFFVTDFRPCFYYIRIQPCLIADINIKRIYFIFQFNNRQSCILFLKMRFLHAFHYHLQCQIAVCMANGQSRFTRILHSIGRISIYSVCRFVNTMDICIRSTWSIIQMFQTAALRCRKKQLCTRGGYNNILPL